MDMTGKTVLITGASRGIGAAAARAFVAQGARVTLVARTAEAIADLAGELGDAALAVPCDISRFWEMQTAVDATIKTFGRLDVLVNNAGAIEPIAHLAEADPDAWGQVIDINLKGVLFGAQAAYPYLQKTAPGSCLLNTASAAGIYGTPGASVYSATKFGVRAITESLDGEWAADGIDVRSLMPSFIDTPLLDHNPNARSNEGIRQRVTDSGLEITPVDDVAAAAWAAVHGERLHTTVGKTAKRMAFAARWLPGRVRKGTRAGGRPMGR